MTNLQYRLSQLKMRLTRDDALRARADVHDALVRQGARARLKICQRLGVDASDPRVVEAVTRLAGDDAARSAHDAELIARWRRAQGIVEDAGEIRERLAQRLEAMARRQRDEARERSWGSGGVGTRIQSARLSASGGHVKRG